MKQIPVTLFDRVLRSYVRSEKKTGTTHTSARDVKNTKRYSYGDYLRLKYKYTRADEEGKQKKLIHAATIRGCFARFWSQKALYVNSMYIAAVASGQVDGRSLY